MRHMMMLRAKLSSSPNCRLAWPASKSAAMCLYCTVSKTWQLQHHIHSKDTVEDTCPASAYILILPGRSPHSWRAQANMCQELGQDLTWARASSQAMAPSCRRAASCATCHRSFSSASAPISSCEVSVLSWDANSHYHFYQWVQPSPIKHEHESALALLTASNSQAMDARLSKSC